MRLAGFLGTVALVVSVSGIARAGPLEEARALVLSSATATVSLGPVATATRAAAGTRTGTVAVPEGAVLVSGPEAEDIEVQARLTFIRQRLERTQPHAQYWTWGWLSFYTLGLGIQTTRASLATGRSAKADLTLSSIKAGIGIVGLALRLPRSRHGADDIPEADPQDPAGNRAALVLAENALRKDLRKAKSRRNWIAHSTSIAMGLLHTIIIGFGYDDWNRAIRNGLVSIAFGEAVIWSTPWEAEGDWEEYQATFGPPVTSPPK